MQVKHLTANQREEWNALAAQEPSFALLQSWEWGEFKSKLGWKVFRIAAQEESRIIAGAQMLIRSLPFGLASVAYIPRGPIGNWLDERIASQLLSELHRVAQQHHAIQLKIEPPLLQDPTIDRTLHQYRFQPSSISNQPPATIVVDLLQDLDDIWRHVRRRTRNYVKASAGNGVSVRQGDQNDLPAFYDMMRITARRARFSPAARIYYEEQWRTFADNRQTVLLIADYQGQPLAVHMAYCFRGHAAYFHGASSGDYRELRPNHLLMWEAIKWAKERGCRTFDLWGIPDEVCQAVSEGKEPPVSDRTDGLWGVYRFKRGFSKNVVCYLGAYDHVYRPLLYAIITSGFLNSDILHRLSAMMDSFAHT